MIKAFILAAGFSKRLRPITEHIPKALLPIAGETLLDHIYKSLKKMGIVDIGINLHYKGHEIEDYIRKNELPIKTFWETEILDTGGALYNARKFLEKHFFIVHNCDIYTDLNIKEALDWHIKESNDITLLIHDHLPDNKLIVDDDNNFLGIITKRSTNKEILFKKTLAYTGVAIYSPRIIELLQEGPSSIIELWFKALNSRRKIKAFRVKYNFWHDIGTPIGYARAVFDKLKRNSTSIYVHPSSRGCEKILPEGYLVIEKNVTLEKNFRGKNLIILPEAEFSCEREKVEDSIIGRNFIISINGWQKEKEILFQSGSNRTYWRCSNGVVCQWEEVTKEFEKSVILGKIFKNKGIKVPEIIKVDRKKNTIIFEDLGDLTLFSWLQCRREENEILDIYKKIIEQIARLHWEEIDTSRFGINLPLFDYKYFRWESEYFLKECVNALFGIENENIEEEFHLIANELQEAKKVLLHRDLQSQNIILKGNIPYLIDYQSARWGPPSYDLASLLWDPYVNLSDTIRQKAVNYYIEICSNRYPKSFYSEFKTFKKELILCRLQRHMQALGAYGFLSLKKGKKIFLTYIPSAISLLGEDIKECPFPLPKLKSTLEKIKEKLPYAQLF